jgi:hypothetical protein
MPAFKHDSEQCSDVREVWAGSAHCRLQHTGGGGARSSRNKGPIACLHVLPHTPYFTIGPFVADTCPSMSAHMLWCCIRPRGLGEKQLESLLDGFYFNTNTSALNNDDPPWGQGDLPRCRPRYRHRMQIHYRPMLHSPHGSQNMRTHRPVPS